MPGFSAEKFIKELDSFFAREDLSGAGKYLRDACSETDRDGDERGKLTVLNEMIGFFRQTGEGEAALKAIEEALALIEKTGIAGEISGATVYLNCATTLKCFGKSREAMKYYDKTQAVYDKKLDKNHPLVAGLYNNKALALQDIGETGESEKCFRKAIEITLTDSANALETAVSYVNLAHLLFDKNPLDEEVNRLLDRAFEILMNPRYYSFSKYAFTCRKCAPSYGFFGRFADEKILNERADEVYAGN